VISTAKKLKKSCYSRTGKSKVVIASDNLFPGCRLEEERGMGDYAVKFIKVACSNDDCGKGLFPFLQNILCKKAGSRITI